MLDRIGEDRLRAEERYVVPKDLMAFPQPGEIHLRLFGTMVSEVCSGPGIRGSEQVGLWNMSGPIKGSDTHSH